ncbi:MAG: type I restriction endonuclease, partial [Fermentimonas sp.]|nr:type I restriction endonuclease [Fermentimonas sp.]
MPTDTSEYGLESLIVESLVEEAHYLRGDPHDFDREYVLDLTLLLCFLEQTQPEVFGQLDITVPGPKRVQFLHRLYSEIAKRGIVDVLRSGIKHGPHSIELYYSRASGENSKAKALHESNIFSVTRQLRYSREETALALDLAIFINGLPIATFELKNKLTKQTVHDAVQQYKRDRDPKEPLFAFGRCLVHFAVDDHEVKMCTHLKGNASWFLPFNKGYKDGAGNPPNPKGIATDYLWKEILCKEGLSDILENYAQLVEEKDSRGKKKRMLIFPRYHQLDLVHKLLADVDGSDMGKRYL